MPSQALLFDAMLFAGIGFVLALAGLWIRPALRRAMFRLILMLAVGLGALLLLSTLPGADPQATLRVVLREVALLILAIAVAGIALTFTFEALLGGRAVPRILADVLMALALIGFALYRMNVAGVNIAGIVTTSAIITGVIAFSLQEALGNLWGGIALQVDNTCRIGDWIRVDDLMGKVVSIRWRYVAIATNDDETIIVPNSTLMKQKVTVIGRRGDDRVPWRRRIEFFTGYDVPPSRVIAIVDAALRRAEIPYVVRSPEPSVRVVKFDASTIRYAVRFWVDEPYHDEWIDSQVALHAHSALGRHGIEMPFPRHVLTMLPPRDAAVRREETLAARVGMLRRIELFSVLTEAEQRALATELVDCPFVAGDVISRQGEVADSLYILARGRVDVFRGSGPEEEGGRARLATLEAPACFGEMGLLTGQARTATTVACDEVLCHRLDKPGFDAIVLARPELIEELSKVQAVRIAANDATLHALDEEARARRTSSIAAELLHRIRAFFGVGR
jgi:small-conductance mechanosensitive channel/CRP-like cAMP-binding protein